MLASISCPKPFAFVMLGVMIAMTPTLRAQDAAPGFDGLPLAQSRLQDADPSEATAEEGAQFQELVRLAAARRLTEPQAERSLSLVQRLGGRRPFRRSVAALLNRNGGRLDRRLNAIMCRRAWKHHGPLPNLAEVTGSILRGGQPNAEGFRALKEKGVRTVVNLRMEDDSERTAVTSTGMAYLWMPIPDTDAPSMEQARAFLIAAGRATPASKLFFHCAAGSYRTGTMAAVYRVSSGQTPEAALEEAGRYGWREAWLNADREGDFVRAFPRGSAGRRPDVR